MSTAVMLSIGGGVILLLLVGLIFMLVRSERGSVRNEMNSDNDAARASFWKKFSFQKKTPTWEQARKNAAERRGDETED